MWRSSELSISSSIPVILPARLGCMFWIRGNRRSPEEKEQQLFSMYKNIFSKTSVSEEFYCFQFFLKNILKNTFFYMYTTAQLKKKILTWRCTNPASASVPEEGQQPAWRQSGAPVLEHGQRAKRRKKDFNWLMAVFTLRQVRPLRVWGIMITIWDKWFPTLFRSWGFIILYRFQPLNMLLHVVTFHFYLYSHFANTLYGTFKVKNAERLKFYFQDLLSVNMLLLDSIDFLFFLINQCAIPVTINGMFILLCFILRWRKFSGILTCCMVTCGWEAICCWGLRTPAAYLYWGMVRTGAAVAEAPAGRWPRAWVAEEVEKGPSLNLHQVLNKKWGWGVGGGILCALKAYILTHTLGSHHARDLGVGGGWRTDGVEGLGPGSWWPHSIGHVLEVWRKRKDNLRSTLVKLKVIF